MHYRLIALILIYGAGCTSEPAPLSSQAAQDAYLQGLDQAEEAAWVFYQTPGARVVADLWVPENPHGLTRAELRGDGGAIDAVVVYAGDAVAAELRAGPDGGLVGATVSGPEGTRALILAVDGPTWTWQITHPDGRQETRSEHVPGWLTPAPAPPSKPALRALAQTRQPGPNPPGLARTATIALSQARAAVTWTNRGPGPVPEAVRAGTILFGSCTASDPAVECDTDVSGVDGQLYVHAWVRTDLTDVGDQYWTYERLEDCQASQSTHNLSGYGLGLVLGFAGYLVPPLGGAMFAAGAITATFTLVAEPLCGGLITNQALVADALNRHAEATVIATWDWIVAAAQPAGWDVVETPRAATFAPFTNSNRGGADLPGIEAAYVFAGSEPPAPDTPPEPAGVQAGRFQGNVDATQLVSRPVAAAAASLAVTIGPDGGAVVALDVDIRTGGRGRSGCLRGSGLARGVFVSADGSFSTDLPFRGTFRDVPAGTEDPCATLGAPEPIPVRVSGQLDPAGGAGQARINWAGTEILVPLQPAGTR